MFIEPFLSSHIRS